MLKKGFTLAEVLITLAIVGVIAAFTLPALMSNFQKRTYETAIKKAYNSVSEAVALYMTNEGLTNLSEAPFINNQENLREFVREYFKVATNCGNKYYNANGEKCFGETLSSLDQSTSTSLASKTCMVVVNLYDGTSMCFDASKSKILANTSTDPDKDNSRSLYIEVDTNGPAGPNVSGRDVFSMDINQSGMVYDREWDITKKDTLLNKYKKSASTPMPIGRIRSDGWKMEY